jgi:hypothetical protein
VGCKGGADCALLKDPKANAATLSDPKSVASLTVTNLLPPDLLCTFTRAVMESLAAVARAPVGGGAADISVASIPKATDVVKAAINGMCTWEDAGLELATRMDGADEDDMKKISAALSLLKATSDKAGSVAQAAVQAGVGLLTFVWGKVGAHIDAVNAGTVRILAKSAGSASSAEMTVKVRRPKLVAFVLHMVDDTELAYRSISNYLWAFCTWLRMQRQADPRRGVERWSEFMQSVKVIAFEVSEPRREIPLSLLISVAEKVDESDFRQVNAFFFLLIMFFTFSRSECPLPLDAVATGQ